MTKDEKSILNALAVFAAWTPLFVFRCYVLSVLWVWFAVPLGAPALPVAVVAGWLCIRWRIFGRDMKRYSGPDIEVGVFIFRSLGISLLAWGIGAIAHWVA